MRKILLALLAAGMLVSTLAACGGGDNVSYRPAAYGENGHCYYVEDPSEVYGLERDGYCHRDWTPMLMPLYWHMMYAPYYSSPAYYGRFVPRQSRTVFISHQTTFVNSHQSEIKSAVKTATYQGSNGKKVSGSTFGTRTFTGGGSRGGFGGGSNRKTCGMAQSTGSLDLVMRGGGSGGHSGGGSRGGSSRSGSRSGSGGSKSRSGSGSKGGC
jgi:hypothetical protein